MVSRPALILFISLGFALGFWGGRQIASGPVHKPEAIESGVSASRPEVQDSAADLRARIEATPTADLVALVDELADRRWPDLESLLAYRSSRK